MMCFAVAKLFGTQMVSYTETWKHPGDAILNLKSSSKRKIAILGSKKVD